MSCIVFFWAKKNFLLFVLLSSRQSCNTSYLTPKSTAHSHHPLFLAFLVTLLILDAICFINSLYFDILNNLLKRLIEILIYEAKKEGREATLIYHKLDIDGERNRPSVTKNNNTGLSQQKDTVWAAECSYTALFNGAASTE